MYVRRGLPALWKKRKVRGDSTPSGHKSFRRECPVANRLEMDEGVLSFPSRVSSLKQNGGPAAIIVTSGMPGVPGGGIVPLLWSASHLSCDQAAGRCNETGLNAAKAN